MKTREEGFYWVKPTNPKWTNQECVVAYWEAWTWWLPGNDIGAKDECFEVLSERIQGPDDTKASAQAAFDMGQAYGDKLAEVAALKAQLAKVTAERDAALAEIKSRKSSDFHESMY